MADARISDLTNGGIAQANDAIPIARGGANYSISPDAIQQYMWSESNTWAGTTVFDGAVTFNTTVNFAKLSASGTAPGAGLAKFEVVAGTTAGTAKLIMYAGTSATPITIIDNVGAGF